MQNWFPSFSRKNSNSREPQSSLVKVRYKVEKFTFLCVELYLLFTRLVLLLLEIRSIEEKKLQNYITVKFTHNWMFFPLSDVILTTVADTMGFQYLFRICGNFTPIIHDIQNGWGWKYYIPLFVCVGLIPRTVHFELDLSVLHWRTFWYHCCRCWNCANNIILWLFLLVYYERWVFQRIECQVSIKINLLLVLLFFSFERKTTGSSCLKLWTPFEDD